MGEKVKVLDLSTRRWVSGEIRRKLRERSYEIRLMSGNVVVRNRRHIIKDSIHRQSLRNDYDFTYDSENSPQNRPNPFNNIGLNMNNNIDTNHYVTRSGRIVRPPVRWGYDDC